MPERQRGRDAAGAYAEHVAIRAARNFARRLHRFLASVDVLVESPLAIARSRISPADCEQRDTVFDRILEEAAPRREVHDVELVDLRRNDDQRPFVNLFGRARLLYQLEERASLHD